MDEIPEHEMEARQGNFVIIGGLPSSHSNTDPQIGTLITIRVPT